MRAAIARISMSTGALLNDAIPVHVDNHQCLDGGMIASVERPVNLHSRHCRRSQWLPPSLKEPAPLGSA
jgi:hypothetical protein